MKRRIPAILALAVMAGALVYLFATPTGLALRRLRTPGITHVRGLVAPDGIDRLVVLFQPADGGQALAVLDGEGVYQVLEPRLDETARVRGLSIVGPPATPLVNFQAVDAQTSRDCYWDVPKNALYCLEGPLGDVADAPSPALVQARAQGLEVARVIASIRASRRQAWIDQGVKIMQRRKADVPQQGRDLRVYELPDRRVIILLYDTPGGYGVSLVVLEQDVEGRKPLAGRNLLHLVAGCPCDTFQLRRLWFADVAPSAGLELLARTSASSERLGRSHRSDDLTVFINPLLTGRTILGLELAEATLDVETLVGAGSEGLGTRRLEVKRAVTFPAASAQPAKAGTTGVKADAPPSGEGDPPSVVTVDTTTTEALGDGAPARTQSTALYDWDAKEERYVEKR